MAYSTQRSVSDGTLQLLMIEIEFFDKSEITAYFNDLPTTDFQWATDKSIRFDSVVPAGVEVLLRRTTDLSSPRHVFTRGAQFKAGTLDEDFKQILHIAQEAVEGANVGDLYQPLNMHGNPIKNIGPATEPGDAVSLGQIKTESGGAWLANQQAQAAAVSASQSAQSAGTSANVATVKADEATNAANRAEIAAGTIGNNVQRAESAANRSEAASSSSLTSANTATEKAAQAVNAADMAERAKDAATLNSGMKDNITHGLATTTSGQYFSVPGPSNTEYASLYRNTSGAAVFVDTYPNSEAIDELGIEEQDETLSGLIFSVTDSDLRRTWIEADLKGDPTKEAAARIGGKLNAETAPTLVRGIVDQAVEEAVEEVGMEVIDELNKEIIFGVVDEEGGRTWIEAGADGGPTPNAIAKVGPKLNAGNSPVLNSTITANAIAQAVPAATEAAVAEVGIEVLGELNDELSFAIVDESGSRTWIEADKAGKPTKRAMSLIVENLPEDIGGAAVEYDGKKLGVAGIVSGPNITSWGDSMTAGAGGGGKPYTLVLQQLMAAAGIPGVVNNRGVGGENTLTIAARAGAHPFLVIPTGLKIPAGTAPFQIDLQAINGFVPKPLMQGPSNYTGRLGGVAGTFSKTNEGSVYTYFFARKEAGAEIVADRPLPMYLDIGDAWRNDIAIIWIGQNGPSDVRAVQDAKAIIARMTSLDKRFLVISKPGGTSADDVNDSMWFAEFGRRFIAIRQYMVKYGLADLGITPTEQDLVDISNGTVPTSIRTDSVHWHEGGYKILGNIIFQRLIEMEWI